MTLEDYLRKQLTRSDPYLADVLRDRLPSDRPRGAQDLNEAMVNPSVSPEIVYARQRITELERENAKLREDMARLDSGMIRMGGCIHKEVDLRSAIDRAINYEAGNFTHGI